MSDEWVPETGARTGLWARVAGGVLVAAAVGLALEASTFEVAFMTDPIGPKALPYLVAVMLAGSGLAALLRPDREVSWPSRTVLLRMAAAAVTFVAYALLFPWIGFFLATTGAVAVLSSLYGARRLPAVGAGAALAAFLWVLFSSLLGLPLPIGDLWTR